MPKRPRDSHEIPGERTLTEQGLMPQKRHYRQRAHANPFSDHALRYPPHPLHFNMDAHFPAFKDMNKRPEFADIGCGFGGLLISLAPLFPDTLMLGLEIRVQVTQYVQDRITALRVHSACAESSKDRVPGGYNNISVTRANAMKFLPNFFGKHQLSKVFFLFPDPHFKMRKHKARIISPALLAEYAYVLRPGGIIYTITDVQDLHEWMVKHLCAFPLFQQIEEDIFIAEGHSDILELVKTSTEKARKLNAIRGINILPASKDFLILSLS